MILKGEAREKIALLRGLEAAYCSVGVRTAGIPTSDVERALLPSKRVWPRIGGQIMDRAPCGRFLATRLAVAASEVRTVVATAYSR